jgi:hypothetical protein
MREMLKNMKNLPVGTGLSKIQDKEEGHDPILTESFDSLRPHYGYLFLLPLEAVTTQAYI